LRGKRCATGTFLAKIFGGAEADAVFRELKPFFADLRRLRPEATRKESFELYFLGKGFGRQATR
jgi:23S rRNA (uridine2552-2'-O)-methyltransferase